MFINGVETIYGVPKREMSMLKAKGAAVRWEIRL